MIILTVVLGVSVETEIGIFFFNNFPSNDFVSYYIVDSVWPNTTRICTTITDRLPKKVQSYLILRFHIWPFVTLAHPKK